MALLSGRILLARKLRVRPSRSCFISNPCPRGSEQPPALPHPDRKLWLDTPHISNWLWVLPKVLPSVFWSFFSDQTSLLKVPKLLPVLCPEESLVHSSAQIVNKHLVSTSLGRAGTGQPLAALSLILVKLDWALEPRTSLAPGKSRLGSGYKISFSSPGTLASMWTGATPATQTL